MSPNQFSKRSLERLRTCHPILQDIMYYVLDIVDITILEGERGEEAQTKAFNEGRSKTQYPNSKHNGKPSLAVDVAPYPIDWEDLERFVYLAGVVHAVAYALGYDKFLRWGGDWDRDGQMTDERFRDYVHFELVGDLEELDEYSGFYGGSD